VRNLAWWLGSLALVACTEPGADSRTFNDGSGEVVVAVAEVEPRVEVYRDVERCVGLTGNPYAAEWYRLDEPIRFSDGSVWYGAYITKGRQIYFIDDLAAKHEVIHDLVWTNARDTTHNHPAFGVCDR
jgi:hypothetical protein